eukprot:scaffold290548_cov33-Tisochrysis_lutea.AAC.2
MARVGTRWCMVVHGAWSGWADAPYGGSTDDVSSKSTAASYPMTHTVHAQAPSRFIRSARPNAWVDKSCSISQRGHCVRHDPNRATLGRGQTAIQPTI